MHGVARAAGSQSLAIHAAALWRLLPDFWLDIFLDIGTDVSNNVPSLCILTCSFYRGKKINKRLG